MEDSFNKEKLFWSKTIAVINQQRRKKKMKNLIKQRSWEGGVLEVLVMKYIEENDVVTKYEKKR